MNAVNLPSITCGAGSTHESFAARINRPELALRARELVAEFDPVGLTLQEILMIGQEQERIRAADLDRVLSQFTAENSPFVFKAFEELQKGIQEANLDELEERIRTARKPGFFGNVFGSATKRMLSFTREFDSLLKGKRDSLLELVRKMETEAQKETEALIRTIKQTDEVANGFLATVDGLALQVMYIDGALEKARGQLQSLRAEIGDADDVARRYRLKEYEYLVVQLENRRLILMNSYERTPTDLEMLATTKQTAANTFVEIANSLMMQLNGVKTALVQWSMLATIESSQLGDEARRRVAEQLFRHGVVVLDRLAIVAASTPYERRLADAQLLVSVRSGVAAIQQKVLAIEEEGRRKFGEAEQLLLESRKILLPAPSN